VDQALWIVDVRGRQPLRIRLGAGRAPIASDPAVRVESLSGSFLTVRNIAGLELTAAQLGRGRFSPGDWIDFTSTFWAHCRSYRVDWQGNMTLTE
jgi:hypothetical protein